MGGFAAAHHQTVLKLEERNHARLVCTCDPNPNAFLRDQDTWKFLRRGVRVFSDYREMLTTCRPQLDLLVVPTPIPLHADMHRAGIQAGLAVYLEKPPSLDFVELEEMIALDRTAPKASMVGFNFIIEAKRQSLKQRLLTGEFGAIKEARLIGRWPRPTSYFQRNDWAGRLLTPTGRVILDSCLGNAMAHFVHNLFFWVGQDGLMSWGTPAAVKAELYRAHAIEGADTFFIQTRTREGAELRIALSHACMDTQAPLETIHCEKATLRYAIGEEAQVTWLNGRTERHVLEPFDALSGNHLAYYRYLQGKAERPPSTLVDSRPLVVMTDLAHVSSGQIDTLSPPHVRSQIHPQDLKEYFAIEDLSVAQTDFLENATWPSTRGWSRSVPAADVTPDDLNRFHSTIHAMAGK